MNIIKTSFVLICFSIYPIAYSSEVVVGPSSGFVAGPTPEGNGLSLNNIIANYNLVDKSEDDNAIQKNVYLLDKSDGKVSCQYNPVIAKEMTLKTGAARLDLLQSSVAMLDNPNRAKQLLDPAQSESMNMTTASETLGASSLTANESNANLRSNAYNKLCSKLKNTPRTPFKSATTSDQNQLNAYVCMAYQMMNHITNLFADSDTLFQKTTEVDAIVNKAMAEQTTRTAAVQVQENNIKQVNKDLKAALDKLKKAKEDLKKANEALKAASAAPADEGDSDAKGSATAAAQAAVTKSQEAVDKSGKELLEFLKTKMNFETRTILALLSGTIYGDANGTDVHFKVSDKEFTLVNTDEALSSMFGLKPQEPHWGRYLLEHPEIKRTEGIRVCGAECPVDPGYAEEYAKFHVDSYFQRAANHLSVAKNDSADKKYYMVGGGEISREQSNLQIARPAESDKATGDILEKFYSMGSGTDNIETIAMALADYQANGTAKQQTHLESMKTPETRLKYSAQVIDKTNELNQNVRVMIVNNICYLDSILSILRNTRNATNSSLKAKSFRTNEEHLKYLYYFKTTAYKKKLDEGYKSDVKVDATLKQLDDAINRSLTANPVVEQSVHN